MECKGVVLCNFVLFCENKSIVSVPEGHDRHAVGIEQDRTEDHGDHNGNDAGGDIATAFGILEDLLHKPSLLPVFLGQTRVFGIQRHRDPEYTQTTNIRFIADSDRDGISQLHLPRCRIIVLRTCKIQCWLKL